jgi:low temperature requirement protein LtrA
MIIVLGTEEQKEKDDVAWIWWEFYGYIHPVRLWWLYKRAYIMKQKYESDKFKDGVVDEFDEIY